MKIHTLEYVDYLLEVEFDQPDASFNTTENPNIYPNILRPYKIHKEKDKIHKEKDKIFFAYKVSSHGKTLRNYINQKHNLNNSVLRSSIRNTFYKRPIITHIDILLQLIKSYELLLGKNNLIPLIDINPDLIWIDYNNDYTVKIQILDVLNNMPVYNYDHKIYWSPEVLGEYLNNIYSNINSVNNIRPINNLNQTNINKLNRVNTRRSSLNVIYSIGLVFYFIIKGKDPFHGYRIYNNDHLVLTDIKPLYKEIISIATNNDPKNRPTLSEWHNTIINLNSQKKKYFCLNIINI